MNKQVSKFLEFNGKTLVFLAVDGEYWVALKPICEALNVEYTRTFKNSKADPIFGAALAIQPMQVPGDQTRNMICLPEKWIYGWLISIQSASPELQQYKKQCYEVLNNYFHGAITGRKNLLREKAKIQIEINSIFKRLSVEDTLILDRAKSKINRINGELRRLDGEMIQEERNLFNN
jgi:hypothetical protein